MGGIQKYQLKQVVFFNFILNLICENIADVVCEMDLLRTQKIRYLVSIYREMERPIGQQKEQRLALIEKVLDVLSQEEVSAQRNEVGI